MGRLKKPTPWIMGGLSLGILLISIGSYAVIGRRADNQDSLEEFTIPVKAERVTLRIAADGTVTPVQSVNLSPKVAGVVEQLLVEQGERVEKGQVVALMDKRDLEGQMLQAQGALAQAQARLAELQRGNRSEEIAQAKARLDRWEARVTELKAGSRQEEIQQAEARLRRAEAQLAEVEAGNRPEEIAQIQSQVAAAEAQVNLTTKRAQSMRNLVAEGAEAQDRLDEAIANDESAKANLREAQKRLDVSRKGARREERLRAQADVADARQAYDLVRRGNRPEIIEQAEADAEEARQAYELSLAGSRPEQIDQAAAAVEEAEGRLQTVQNQLEDTKIRAPFGGIITQKFASKGAFVTPTTSSSTTASATSASIVALAKDFEVLAEVPEIDISKVKPGQKVEIRADAYPDQVFQGKVRLVSPEAVEQQDVTLFQVRVTIISGRAKLRSGMNATLTFLGETLENTLVVPTVAIATQKGKTGVYVPGKENKPEFKPITIGSSILDKTQVLEGVTSGQRVFINFPEGQEPKDSEK